MITFCKELKIVDCIFFFSFLWTYTWRSNCFCHLQSSQLTLFRVYMTDVLGGMLYLFLNSKVEFSPYIGKNNLLEWKHVIWSVVLWCTFLQSSSLVIGEKIFTSICLYFFCGGACEWGFWQWWHCGPLPCPWEASVLHGF